MKSMKNMKKYEELKEKIGCLQFTDFNYKKKMICYDEMYVSSLLRQALIYYNNIGELDNETEQTELEYGLDFILGDKIKQLNPNFSDNIIKDMLCCCKRGIFQYPIDIYVISDAVFTKEAAYDDFGNLYKIKTFMFDNNGSYFNIYQNLSFCVGDNIFEYIKKRKISLTKEMEMEISKFISDRINETLLKEYQCCVTKPIYELNNDKSFYGYKGLVEAETHGVNIYLNKKFSDIAYDIIKKCECDIKMCVQYKDNISLYNFHQSFNNEEPVWTVEKLDLPVWKLSEEALKKENSLLSPQKKLKPTKNIN